MGICAEELRNFVIKPTLQQLGDWSPVAERLLLGTAAQESGLGFHLKYSRSRGLGIYQITPRTHTNVWDKYLIRSPDLASFVRGLASQHKFLTNPHAELTTNLSYATAIAWMIYRRSGKTLSVKANLNELAKFWARYFQTRQTGTVDDFINHYQQFVAVCNEGEGSGCTTAGTPPPVRTNSIGGNTVTVSSNTVTTNSPNLAA